jgi:hypothetical protein
MDPKSPESIFRQWRIADERATQAELALFNASLLSLEGSCPPPPEEEWQHARQLRATASELFRQSMKDVSRLNAAAARLLQQPPAPAKGRGHDGGAGQAP